MTKDLKTKDIKTKKTAQANQAGVFDTENRNTEGVYEPHADVNDDPAESQADMDPTQKRASTLADGTVPEHANVRKTATRADGPDVTGVKVAD